ncbi:unnamed protein product [Linum tenue]|uniref:Uncharacterized protein n=1 Tax=Linum tenue TaxID=586396 RepID=A0AAV0KTL4_9ROSI|nr:unnamed protein product [Linum tenue]CAI0425391.1 unnamed protein product [Linum tenue]
MKSGTVMLAKTLSAARKMDIAVFSPSALFAADDDDASDEETTETQQSYVERQHSFPGMVSKFLFPFRFIAFPKLNTPND